jgi:hypothetical protein
LFAQDAPEIVLEFHLGKTVLVAPDYETFARQRRGQYLVTPERLAAGPLAAAPVREVGAALVAGRRFVLLRKE